MEALRLFLEGEGHQVYVFAPRYPGYKDPVEFVTRFPSVTFPAKVRWPLALPVAPGMFRRVADLGIDVFHTHHPFGMGVIARNMARRLRRPLVTTIHTQYEQYLHYIPAPRFLSRPITRWLVVRYCNSCQGITTPAAGMADVIRGYGVRGEVTVVPNGADLRRYRDASGEEVRRRHGLGPEHVLALFTGRLAPEKNLPALLETAGVLARAHPNFRLMLLGDGPAMPDIRRQVEALGIADSVLLPGSVPHDAVPPYCAAADVFVTASTTEVNPTSIIEAMAAGTPTVAYDTFGAREIVHEGVEGILTEHSPAALAGALDALLRDRERLRRMAAAASAGAERFSLAATGPQMLAVYRRAQERMEGRCKVSI